MAESLAVDLAADIGEGFGAYRIADDEAILSVVSSANVACGFHAGDPRIMDATVGKCGELGVRIGAHPGFPDLVGFGRRAMDLSPYEVETDVMYQIGALNAFVHAHKLTLQHVSPHGRLGNLVVTDESYASAVARAVERVDPSLILVSQEGALGQCARERGLRHAAIALGDRAYEDDGTLVSRRKPNAVISDDQEIVARVIRMVTERRVRSVNGKDVTVNCDSVILHGDSPGAVTFARRVRQALLAEGVQIAPLADVIA